VLRPGKEEGEKRPSLNTQTAQRERDLYPHLSPPTLKKRKKDLTPLFFLMGDWERCNYDPLLFLPARGKGKNDTGAEIREKGEKGWCGVLFLRERRGIKCLSRPKVSFPQGHGKGGSRTCQTKALST